MAIELQGRDRAQDQRVVARMYANGYWEDGAYGFQILHNKRPFGNSSWTCDILEELEIEPDGTEEPGSWGRVQHDYASELMNGVQAYLQEILKGD